jgi:hypothetical protein
MNEGSGNTIFDLANGAIGTFVGANLTWEGGAIDWNAGSSYINFGDILSKGQGDYLSVAAMLRIPDTWPDATYQYYNIACKSSLYASGYGLVVYQQTPATDIRYVFWTKSAGGGQSQASDSNTPNGDNGVIYSWVGTYGRDGNDNLELWINGDLKATDTGYPDDSSDLLLIGEGDSGQTADKPWLDKIYYVYVWNRVLTQAEITLLHREPYGMFR